ncbi:CynX/NimT family MFS transporter [soil metagenome]
MVGGEESRDASIAIHPASGASSASLVIGAPIDLPGEGEPIRPAVSVALLLAGIGLVGLNLRGSIVGVGPLLKDIQTATGLPATALGLLVTLPLLGFGLVSPIAPALARRFGIERLLLWSLAVLCLGTVFRSLPDAWLPFLPDHAALFFGTALIGCCIAIGNVMVPALIRRDLPERMGPVTSIFVATFAGTGAVAAAIAVPLEQWVGWRGSLALWAIPAVVGVLVWVPVARGRKGISAEHAQAAKAGSVNVWKSPLAWYVTAYMGLQGLCFYVLVTWLPSVLRDAGQSPATAGFLTFAFQLACLAGTSTTPMLVARVRDQRAYAVGSSLITLVGYVLLIVEPSWPLSALLTGFGCGCNLGVAIVLFSARAANSNDTAALSGMAQSLGYLLAAAGPVVVGTLRDTAGNWDVALGCVALVAGCQAVMGWLAGRPGTMKKGAGQSTNRDETG